MNQNLLRQYIETYVQDNWILTPIRFENTDFAQSSTTPYISFHIEPEDTIQIGFPKESLSYRNTGLLVFEIFAPFGSGSYLIRESIDSITDLFVGKQIETITFRSLQTQKIGRIDEWYLTIAFVEYYYDSVIN